MGLPVTVVPAGGIAVTEALNGLGLPVSVVTAGGLAVTQAPNGLPVVGLDTGSSVGPAYRMRALAGSFVFSGVSMSIQAGYTMPAGAGAFTLAGQSATLTPPVVTGTTWDAATKAPNITLSNGNLTAKNVVGSAFAGVRSVASHTTGKYYCELTADAQNFAAFSQLGIATAAASLTASFGGDTNSMATSGGCNVTCNGATLSSTGDGYGVTGQGAGMAIDLTAKKVWFWSSAALRWNGDVLANQNPMTGVGGLSFSAIAAGPYFACNTIWQLNDQTTLNFGATAYANPAAASLVSAGFGNW